MNDKMPTIFLVTGAPRSGTTFMQNVLNTHPGVTCLHEFQLTRLDRILQELFFAEDQRTQFLEDRERVLGATSSSALDEDTAPTTSAKTKVYDEAVLQREAMIERAIGSTTLQPRRRLHRDRVVQSLFSIVSGKSRLIAYGDKEPNIRHRTLVDDLRRRFPELKIIYVIRNPIDVVRSSMRRVAATRIHHDNWPIKSLQEAIDEWVLNWEHAASEHRRSSPNDIFIRYEDALGNFNALAGSLEAFLGLPRRRLFGLGRSFADLASTIPPDKQDFALTDAQEEEVRARVGSLAAAWQDHAIEFLLESYPEFSPVLHPGEIFSPRSGRVPIGIFRDGFSNRESWGVWTDGQYARVSFGVHGASSGDTYRVTVGLARYDSSKDNLAFEVRIPDMSRHVVSIPREEKLEASFDCIVRNGKLDFSFYIPRPKGPNEEPRNDTRALGIGIISMRADQVTPLGSPVTALPQADRTLPAPSDLSILALPAPQASGRTAELAIQTTRHRL